MRKTTSKVWALTAGVTGIALFATGCGSAGPSDDATTASTTEKITLSVGMFNEPGLDKLIKEYSTLNPNITVTQKKAATSNEARDNMNTRLAAGSGLSDVEQIEVDWLAELMQYPDKFVDLTDPALDERWLDWKTADATTADGKLIGYGTDIGPEAVCYRSDLFSAAGLPTDRAEVAKLLGGENATWDDYFAAGKKFTAAGKGTPWMDSASATFQGMVNQVENPYEKADGTIIATENPEIRKMYDAVLEASVADNLSAHLGQWSDDWTSSFQKDGFATMLCPGWMLGVIEGNAAGVTGWDVADVFPGGGGNWGGSFLTVPSQSKHPAEAMALANWLTAPEQQIKAFIDKGTFPSQTEAFTSPDLLDVTSEFFNGAPTGQILVNRADAVTVAPFKGPNYFAVSDAMAQALTRVDVDKTDSPDSSWKKFVTEVSALG